MSRSPARRIAEQAIKQHDLDIEVDDIIPYVVFARTAGADDEEIRETIRQLDEVKNSTDDAHADAVGILAHELPDDVMPDSER